ncbi:hypothetical protein Bca101_096155 [Brassica carinata]
MHSNEEFIKFLGEGSYGYVHLVRYTNPDDDDGSSFLTAVKNSYDEDYDNLNRELQVLLELRGYPRIITCFGDYLEEGLSSYGNRVYKLLLEYASEGSLNTFLNNFPDRKLHEPLIKDFTQMILEGQVPHSWAKDFPWVGTPNYMPPESVRDGVANKTLDLWSVGCLVLEMYTGVVPWEGVKVSDIAARLRCGEAPKIPQSLPSDAKDFIETCFSRNPEERGSAYELLFHPFLPRPQVAEEEKKTGEKKLNSFLLRLLKLKIRRTTSMKKSAKDAVLVADKESLKLRMNPHFKRTLNKVLSYKNYAFEEIHRLQFSVGSLRV